MLLGHVLCCIALLAPQATVSTTPNGATVTHVSKRVRWRFAIDSSYFGHRPTVAPDGTIYVNDTEGRLYAISQNGALLWKLQLDGAGTEGPAAVGADGTIYVASNPLGPEVKINAVHPDGTLVWMFTDWNTTRVIAGPAVGPDGNVYVVTDLGGLGAFSLTTNGDLRWSNAGSPTISEFGGIGSEIVFGGASPSGVPDRMFVAFDTPTSQFPWLYGFGLTGNQEFSARTGGQTDVFLQFQAQPATSPDGTLYQTSLRPTQGWVLESFDPDSGSLLTQYAQTPANGMSPPVIDDAGSAYLVRSLGRLVGVDANAQERWEFFDGSIHYGPALSPDQQSLLVGGLPNFGQPGFIRGFSVAGNLLWQVDLPAEGGALVPNTRGQFSPDGKTGYMLTTNPAAGFGATSYLYAVAIE